MTTNDKAYKFKKLAEKRTTDAMRKIRLIGNLSNKTNYKYDHEQVLQILYALNKEINELEKKFENGKEDDIEFKFN